MIELPELRLKDPETGQIVNLADVATIARRAQENRNPRSRAATVDALRDSLGASLLRIEAELRRRLESGWTILEQSPDADKETRYLSWLAMYESVTDALNVIYAGLIAGIELELTQRKNGDEARSAYVKWDIAEWRAAA